MIKIALIAVAILILLIVVVVAVGLLLPQSHVLSRAITLKQKREAVYAVVSDLKNAASWRKDLQSVEVVTTANGETLYREKSAHGELRYRILATEPPTKFVTEIADKSAFGGTWTIELSEAGEGTRIVITERGEVYNPVFRFMARFVFGHHKTMEAYLRDLAAKFSEEAVITEGSPA
ncbi:MAG: SRPBCC family protein [Betaproteobacteria bacterium]|nr:SRPBCC family protein [Betaproteobacteria bacterium]